MEVVRGGWINLRGDMCGFCVALFLIFHVH